MKINYDKKYIQYVNKVKSQESKFGVDFRLLTKTEFQQKYIYELTNVKAKRIRLKNEIQQANEKGDYTKVYTKQKELDRTYHGKESNILGNVVEDTTIKFSSKQALGILQTQTDYYESLSLKEQKKYVAQLRRGNIKYALGLNEDEFYDLVKDTYKDLKKKNSTEESKKLISNMFFGSK